MRILYIAGNPPGEGSLQIEEEVHRLQAKIDEVESVERVELRVYSSLKVDELDSVITRVKPDVIHFAAHGAEDAIVLAHSERGRVALRGNDLADLLKAVAVRPKLIVVNSCSSEEMAADLTAAADFVIGTNALITNVGARTMAATLYQQLAMSSSLLSAFRAAESMLRIIDCGEVATRLFPEHADLDAQRTTLAEPLRILACFPDIDDSLDEGLKKPGENFDVNYPEVCFGVAGAPDDTTQLVLFTDEETFVATKKQSLESARSWIVESRPVNGEIWLEDWYAYWGDIQWYASVVSAARLVFSAGATTSNALERYYFAEQWRGELPPLVGDAVRRAIDGLRANNGTRRKQPNKPQVPRATGKRKPRSLKG